MTVGPKPNGTAVTSSGWVVTPVGTQVQLGDRPFGMTISPDGNTILVSNNGEGTQSLMVVDAKKKKVIQTIPYKSPEALYMGVAYSPDGKYAYASAGGNNKIRIYRVKDQKLYEESPIIIPTVNSAKEQVNPFPAGLTVSRDGKTLYVANNLGESMSIIDLATKKVTATIPVGHNPYTVVLSKDGKNVYVSNWGGTTVTVVDTTTKTVRTTIKVGMHPSAISLSPDGKHLYVANTDSDSVSIIDTSTNRVVRTISLAPYPHAKMGSSPDAITVSPDGKTLYVANAGNNDIAVIRLDDPTHPVHGLIPTAWYPTALAISPDGKTIYVANAKGLGAGPNPNGPNPYTDDKLDSTDRWQSQYIGTMIKGTLSIIQQPSDKQLDKYTKQVVKNNGFDERDSVRVVGNPKEQVIPRRPGDPSPIKHVIYVVKENRTYDQVLGDLGKGNGDPKLTLFGWDVTPNQHELARRFVTLDNFYVNAEVSVDGWNWSTSAEANTYVEKNWPSNYGNRNRPMDLYALNTAAIPGDDPTKGFIWNELDRAGISYRNYGFFALGTVPAVVPPLEPTLQAHTDTQYNGFNLSVTDQKRFSEWLREFKLYEKTGNLPTVEFIDLPNDHTNGTVPGAPTPKAMVADNDYALGQIVETVSKSKFWKDTAIFVIEDDAQGGPDHVDAHRTIAQVISPYTQTGKVDSTLYTTTSMLRTIELIVGLKPMTQFDASATPMLNSFTDKPNFTPYNAIKPKQSLTEVNPADGPMAAQSKTMNFSAPDLVDEQELNRMIWKSVKGANSPMPASPSSRQ
jgi:YVTN family beta-propeller protein